MNSKDINVKVKDGTAILTGTVNSRLEYKAATENAYEGGATWVENNIKVKTPAE